jgi:hypothetical protein
MDSRVLTAGGPIGPEPHSDEEIAACVAAAAVWAPSVHNTQPWWFSACGREISLYADAGRQLLVADPRGREMMMSCGAALFTARLALRSLGFIPETSVLPDPGRPLLVARVSWRRRAAPAEFERRLFNQVLLRRTHRGGFDPPTLPPGLLAMLQVGAERDGAMLRVVDGEGGRSVLAAVVETPSTRCSLTARTSGNWRGGRRHRAAPGATGCRTRPTRRGRSAFCPNFPAGTSPTAADGASPCTARPRRLGPPVSFAC